MKVLLRNLKRLSGSDNSFFDSIIYGIMFCKSEGKILEKSKAAEVLGSDFYNELLEIKDEAKLDRTIFGYFDMCFKVNNVLSNHNFFLKFFEQQDVFSFLMQKKAQGRRNEETFQIFPVLSLNCLAGMK